MALTGTTPTHPARFSAAIVDAIRADLDALGLAIHDPFAGEGRRLGALADALGLPFTGTDIEPWPDRDPRVRVGDSRNPATYPAEPFVVVTSPVYFGNRISTDYANGPTPTTKRNGRHAYGISLGGPLAAGNLARLCRASSSERHDAEHAAIAALWGDHAIVNVDSPIADRWRAILMSAGFTIVEARPVVTPRLGGGIAGADRRAEHEVVLTATLRELTAAVDER